MDLFEAQEFFKNMYPGKEISYEFDDKCYRTHEIILTNGKPNPVHHIECNKVKVMVQGQQSTYVPILSHRMVCSWEDMKKRVMAMPD